MVGPQLLAKEEWTTVVFKVGPLGSTFTHKLCCRKTEKMLSVSKALQDWKEAQRSEALEGWMPESVVAQGLWRGEGLCVWPKHRTLGSGEGVARCQVRKE